VFLWILSLLQHIIKQLENYSSGNRQGWSDSFLDNSNFNYDSEDEEASLESFINYLFKVVASREATNEELLMFKNHMLTDDNGQKVLTSVFDMFREDRDDLKRNIAYTVLDYISRLDDTYMQKEVN